MQVEGRVCGPVSHVLLRLALLFVVWLVHVVRGAMQGAIGRWRPRVVCISTRPRLCCAVGDGRP
jgi:hypothetical protein